MVYACSFTQEEQKKNLKENFTKGLEFSSIIVLDITWVIDKKNGG
jgi:hypothetical protein